MPNENILCSDCKQNIKIVDRDRLSEEYDRKFKSEKIISDFASLYIFEKDLQVQQMIHELKYGNKFRIGLYLGKEIALILRSKISAWKLDFIIPVPLHTLKKAERGYNQSYFIAKGIGKELCYSVRQNLLSRKRFTETQTNLNAAERKENIREAFIVRNKSKIENARILLVDDVITTGATISECGKVLLNNGAEKIFVVSAAIAK